MFFKKRIPPEQELSIAIRAGVICIQLERNDKTFEMDKMVNGAVGYALKESKLTLPKDQIKLLELAVYAFMGEATFINRVYEKTIIMNDNALDADDYNEAMKILQDSVNEFTKVFKGRADPANSG
jgi:hypothetical protein